MVVFGRAMRDDGVARDQAPNKRHRLRSRRCHTSGITPKPQRQLKIVPHRLALRPNRNFIAPGPVKLRTAQTVCVLGRKDQSDGAIRPFQTPTRNIENRALRDQRLNAPNARWTFNHDLSDIAQRWADKRNPAIVTVQSRKAGPLRPGARFSGAAPADKSQVRQSPIGGRCAARAIARNGNWRSKRACRRSSSFPRMNCGSCQAVQPSPAPPETVAIPGFNRPEKGSGFTTRNAANYL